MTISAFTAARKTCELSGWSISNLHLQKILYFAHMIYMGRNDGQPLIREAFEAWEYGPVVPVVYHDAKGYGSGPIRMGFYNDEVISGMPEEAELEEAWNALSMRTVSELINSTHRPGGAWHKHFTSGMRDVVIPNKDIFQEYKDRINAYKGG